MGSTAPGPAVTPAGGHAVVIGGSIAGLLAARVLADHFERVTVVERDRLPATPGPRVGVPQSDHAHVLLRRGLVILEDLFPGWTRDLVQAGGAEVRLGDILWLSAAGWAERLSELEVIGASRQLVEWLLRRRVTALEGVSLLEGNAVTGLMASPDHRRVTGLTIREADREASPAEAAIEADLVVDAAGRGSRAPRWLVELGFPAPDEVVINSHLGYASRWYQPGPGWTADWKGLLVSARAPDLPRGGVIWPVEDGCWLVTLAGYAGDHPGTQEESFLEFARSLRTPLLHDAITAATPLTPIRATRTTFNQRRRFEALPARPEGFTVVGDAACAFNPVYGQGMSVAALTALALRHELREGFAPGFSRRAARAVARASQAAWLIATGEDSRYPTTEGAQPSRVDRVMHRYLDRVLEVAMRDRVVGDAFVRVLHLLDPPQALFRPAVALRALKGSQAALVSPPTVGVGGRGRSDLQIPS